MHVIDSLFQMSESAANCGGNRHVDVRWSIEVECGRKAAGEWAVAAGATAE